MAVVVSDVSDRKIYLINTRILTSTGSRGLDLNARQMSSTTYEQKNANIAERWNKKQNNDSLRLSLMCF